MADRDCLNRLPELPDLAAELHRLVRQVPRGRVTTYGDLAEALGDRRASRWVGIEMRQHLHGPRCPCHRVVRANGELGSYVTGRLADKIEALQREEIRCLAGRVDLARYGFRCFRGDRPLALLRHWQHELLRRLRLSDPRHDSRIAGMDVSYHGNEGIAAYVELASQSRKVHYQCVRRRAVVFPYIPTYLTFRELPILLDVIDHVRREHSLADIVMVDGSGILHPHRAGVATMLGLVADVPTIGVTKTHLYGQVNLQGIQFGASRDVIDPQTEEVVGAALLPAPTAGKPVYVSPGQGLSVALATRVTQMWLGRRRLPDPIYWADRLSRADCV